MDNNLVSIIMPCHNGAKYLKDSIESVISQTYKDWELFVIDDFSTDNSIDIISDFCKKDNRIKLLKNTKSTGNPATPRNLGIRDATGNYIAFLDCDDIWLPEKLYKEIEILSSGIPIVYTFYEKIDECGNRNNRVVRAPLHTSYRELLKSDVIGNSTSIYNTAVIGKIYQKEVHQEDYIMWLEILKQGYKARCVPEVLALYRVTSSSTSGSKLKNWKWQWNSYRKVLGLNFVYSCYLYTNYAIKGLLKYIK